MKLLRRMIFLVMLMIFVIGCIPVTVQAADAGDQVIQSINGSPVARAATHEHCICGKQSCSESSHYLSSFTAWDGTTTLTSGNYYLTQDVVLTKTMVLNYSYTTRLCLNGYSITCDDMVFQIASSRNLIITDCVGSGFINGINSGETIENYGNLTLWNGQILGSSKYMAWPIILEGGKFHMYGGKVESTTDNAIMVFPGSTINVYGGTVHTDKYMGPAIYGYESGTASNFKMTGGTITTDSGSGAVVIPNCNITISGGNVGAGVSAGGAGRSVTVSGGTIAGTLDTEGSATSITGGNIGGLTLNGNATISDGIFGGTCTFNGSDNTITGGDFSDCDLIDIGGKTWISGGSFSKIKVDNVPLYLNGVPEIDILQPGYASTISAQNPSGTGSFGGNPVQILLDHPNSSWADGDILAQNVTSDAVAQKFTLGGTDADWNYLERSGNNLILRVLPGGQWGNNVTWKIQDGTLTISGTGAIAEEGSGREYPWGPYNDEIRRIVVESGITRIPSYAFEFCEYATSITLPDTLQALSLSAFNDCGSLNNLILPAKLTEFIDLRTEFIRCGSLTDVYFMGTREQWDAIADSDQVTSLQSAMTMHFLELHEGTATCTQAGTESYYQFDKTTVYGSMYNMDLEPITQLQTLPAPGHRVIVEQQVEAVYPQIVNNGTYPFTMSGNTYYSSNHTNSSSSEVTIIAQNACNLTLTYGVGSEKNYDKLYVLYNGVEQDVISGSVSDKSMIFDMSANDQLIVRYSKDYSQSTDPDQGWFSITMNPTTVKVEVQADTLEPDCTNAVVCDYCQTVVKKALGHRVITEQTVQVDPITVTNESNAPFKQEGNKYTSTNKTNNSYADAVFTAQYACEVTLNYGVSSEQNYDFLRIFHNGVEQAAVSGAVSNKTLSLSLAAGDTVKVRYEKDSSYNVGSDCGWVTLVYDPIEITDRVEIPVEDLEAGCSEVVTCSICQSVVLDGRGHNYSTGFCENCGDFLACEGEGTAENPYRIANAGNLYWFAANAGTNAVQGVLTDDITMPAVSGNIPAWTPVNFFGILDGKDHSITGLTMESNGEYLGLFATNRGTIQNLELVDASIVSTRTANGKIGGFAGTNNGTISNCIFRGTVYGGAGDYCANDVGGIAARNFTLISGCVNYGTITGGYTTGGIVGIDSDKDGAATILNCTNYGTITSNGYSSPNAGGIVGYTSGVIQGCVNFSNNITGKQSSTSLGGIVGSLYHVGQHDTAAGLIDCYNLADLPLVDKAYNPNYEKCYVILANCFNYSSNGSPVVKSSTNVDYANCYYLSASETDSLAGTTAMNAEQFASGEVAYLLQQGCTVRDIACPGDAWGQNVDQEAPYDAYPVLSGPEIYRNAVTDCSGAASGYLYSNTQETVGGGHTFVDNFCTNCGYGEGKCGDNVTWTLTPEGVLTISGTGAMYDYTAFAPWYEHNSKIASVVVESGITHIGEYAFYDCENLTTAVIGNDVTDIGNSAFKNCTRLTNISMGSKLTSIGSEAFYECTSLPAIQIPDSVTTIGTSAFYRCTRLNSIRIPEGVTTIADGTFTQCKSLSSVTIPDSVTSIEMYAFVACSSLTSVKIPDGVTSLASRVFSGCENLSNINIPAAVKTIGEHAFYNCISLTSIDIPDGVKSIGASAFYGCSRLSAIEIPSSVTSIGEEAFKDCISLQSAVLSDGLAFIGEKAFMGCANMSSINIPDSVTFIGDFAFSNCEDLISAHIPDGVATIGAYTFNGCMSMTSVTIGSGVTYIGEYAFNWCTDLPSITLPEGVTFIGASAFNSCYALTSIEIPANVTSIGSWAFFRGLNLEEVTFRGNAPVIAADAFEETTTTCYYPAGNATWTDEVRQNYGGTITWQAYGHTTGPVQKPDVVIGNVGLVLKDYIGLQVAVNKNLMNGGAYDKAYYSYVQRNPDGTEAASGNLEFNMAAGNFVGTEFPVLAWSMADTFEITVFYEVDGVVYQGASITTSVKEQAMTRIASTKTDDVTVKTKAVCVAMLNYGANVQDYFNHSDAEAAYLANSELTEEQKALPTFAELNLTGEVVMPDGALKPATKGLNAKDKINVQFAVMNKEMSGYEVRYTIDGVEQPVITSDKFMNLTAGSNTFSGPTIAMTPRQMRSEIAIGFYDAETGEKVYGDIICSVEALAKANEGKATEQLTIAMMVYGDAAEARFGK